jgi:hypothetical protein
MPDLNLLLLCPTGVLSRLRFSLPLLMAIVSAGANAQSTACSGPPVQIDEAVAELHMAHKNPMEFQDDAEFRRLFERMTVAQIMESQGSVFQVDVDSKGKQHR